MLDLKRFAKLHVHAEACSMDNTTPWVQGTESLVCKYSFPTVLFQEGDLRFNKIHFSSNAESFGDSEVERFVSS